MSRSLYDAPDLYDRLMPPGACEGFYRPLAARTGGPVLDLACGTGRLSVPIALDGHVVLGFDRSASMLGAARRKAKQAGASVEFAEGDIQSFDLQRRFSLVMVACNSFAHLLHRAELVAALRCIAGHLGPGGLLAFDVVNPRPASLAAHPSRSVLARNGEATVTEELLDYDPAEQVRVVRWEVSGSTIPRRSTAAMRLRLFFPQELRLLLASAGYELVSRFGCFGGSRLTGDSLNQVCIARPAPD